MLPPVVVVDASVVVAGLQKDEPHHAAAQAVLMQLTLQAGSLYLPAIALAEIAAAIARGTGNSAQAEKEVALVQALPGLVLVPVDQGLGERAAQLAARQRMRGCDAVYVGLAQALQAPLLTLDRQQRERAPEPVVAQTPAEMMEAAP